MGIISASAVLGQGGSFTTNTVNYPSGSVNGTGFNYCTSTCLDRVNHRLFVAEWQNRRVLVFQLDANNDKISDTPANVIGAANFTSVGGGDIATFKEFVFPNLCYDPVNSRLFVPDGVNNVIFGFDVNPATLADYPTALFRIDSKCDDMDYDGANHRLFTSNTGSGRLLCFYLPPGTTGTIAQSAAVFVLGQPDLSTATPGTDQHTMFNTVNGVSYDPVHERVFAADAANNRIMCWSVPAGANSSINGSNALFVVGQADFTSNTFGLTQNLHARPDDMHYDPTTRQLFIAAPAQSRITIWRIPANADSTFNGTAASSNIGQADWTSNIAAVSQSAFNRTQAAHSFDPVNNIYWAHDSANYRVRQFKFVKITTAALPVSMVGIPYSAAIAIANAQGSSQTYSVDSGSLPGGLSLNSSTGEITGTPTTVGDSIVTVRVDDNFSTGPFFHLATYSVPTSGTPTGLALDVAQSAIDVHWDLPGTLPDFYTLDRSPNGTTGWVTIATPVGNATDYMDTGTYDGDAVYYRLKATNLAGDSAYATVNGTSQGPLEHATGAGRRGGHLRQFPFIQHLPHIFGG